VLRVLGNLLNLPGFEYTAADEVTADIRKAIDEAGAFTAKAATRTLQPKAAGAPVVHDVAIYQVDAMVRRSSALQNTREGRDTVRGQSA
jgi:NADH-quinone oxidoreductase subunit G